MLTRLSRFFHRIATRPVTMLAWAVFLLFALVVLPLQAAKATPQEQAAGAPDTSLYYSAEELYAMAGAYGEAGRASFIRAHFTFDVVWPVVYTLFLMIAISEPVGRAFPVDSWWQRANLLPLAAALFDLLENASTALVMARYPAQLPVIASLAGVFTAGKWLLVFANFLVLLAALTARFWRRRPHNLER